MIDWRSVLYAPIYDTLGTTGELRPVTGAPRNFVMLDKTSGVEVTTSASIEVGTIQPAAVLRYPEFIASGLTPDDLEDAELSLNGGEWRVKSWFPRPSPAGEREGEIYMILIENDEASE